MEDIGDRYEEFLKETNDIIERLNALDHPCRFCPMAEESKMTLNLMPRIKLNAEMNVQEVQEQYAENLAEELEVYGSEDGIRPNMDEFRRGLGGLLAEGLDDLDERIESAKNILDVLTSQCEGVVSLMAERNGRRIGVIACGSSALPEGDNQLEEAFVTRYPLA